MKNLKRISFLIVIFVIVLLMFNKTIYAANDKKLTYENLIGKDRYKTSILVSKKAYPNETTNVILVNGSSTTDGPAAQLLAKKLNGPILLIKNKTLGEAKSEIQRLKAKNVYIIGGTDVITKNVEKELTSIKVSTKRLEGKDRYLTAIKLAEKVGSYNKLIICNSRDNGANASAIVSTASQNNIPILYNDSKTKLNANTYKFIQQNASKIKEIYVIGNGFDKTQNNWIKNKGIKIIGITGKNAYEINTKIQEKFSCKYSSLFLVNNTIDAIAANYAATKNASLVLYSNKNLTNEQIKLVKKNDISKIYYTGGDKIKTPLKEIEKALGVVKEGITTSDGSDGYPAGTRLISNGIYTFPEFHQLPMVGNNYTLYQNVGYGDGTLKSKGCNVFASATVVSGLLGDSSVEPISYLNNLKKANIPIPTHDVVFKDDFLKKYYGLRTESCISENKMLELFEKKNGNCAAIGFEPGHYIAIIPIMNDPDGYKFYVIDSAFGYTGKYKSGSEFQKTARANGFSMVDGFGVRAVISP